MKFLSRPDDEIFMRAPSILTLQEIYILSLIATMAEFMRRYDPLNASTLDSIICNHLLLQISEGDASRKDLKEILNPFRVYPFYPPPSSRRRSRACRSSRSNSRSGAFWPRLFG